MKDHKKKEEERRTKAWREHAASYSAAGATTAAPNVNANQVQVVNVDGAVTHNGADSNGMDVDAKEPSPDASPERHLKRKRSQNDEPITSPLPKKAKHEEIAPPQAISPTPTPAPPTDDTANLKRDRERTTVSVSNLPEAATQQDVEKLFKDCGEIREVVLKKLPNELVATVEFMDRESIPAALTKDKKRVLGAEVTVSLSHQSTLFVTNFQEGMDDAKIRSLFEKVCLLIGSIFSSTETRSLVWDYLRCSLAIKTDQKHAPILLYSVHDDSRCARCSISRWV